MNHFNLTFRQVKGIIGDHNYHYKDLGEATFLANQVIGKSKMEKSKLSNNKHKSKFKNIH